MKKIITIASLLTISYPALAEGNIGGAVIPYFIVVIGIFIGILLLVKKAKTTSSKTTSQACYLFVVILGIAEFLLIAPFLLTGL